MRRNGAQAVSDRPAAADIMRLLIVLFGILASAVPALAGDRALIDTLGYSSDLRYFAYEEFGIQDGSGFPYANLYVVDLSTDTWVVGTPFRVLADSESQTLASVRDTVHGQAEETIKGFDISVPAEIIALNGDGMPDNDGKSIAFGVPGYTPGTTTAITRLSLKTFTTTAISPCQEWFSVEPKGLELTLDDVAGPRVLQRDGNLPRSRGCPTDYRLFAVAIPFGAQDLGKGVAIVSSYPGGFEGPDRRFVAVPLGQ